MTGPLPERSRGVPLRSRAPWQSGLGYAEVPIGGPADQALATLLLEFVRVWQEETKIWHLWLEAKSAISPLKAATFTDQTCEVPR